MATKYIFVTGGVVSSLGKGITAASLGRLLKNRGFNVTIQKFDPYINIESGYDEPYQHGEVFVTDDAPKLTLIWVIMNALSILTLVNVPILQLVKYIGL